MSWRNSKKEKYTSLTDAVGKAPPPIDQKDWDNPDYRARQNGESPEDSLKDFQPPIDIQRLTHDMTKNPLDEVAKTVKPLTYAEMLLLAHEILGDGLVDEPLSFDPSTVEKEAADLAAKLHNWQARRMTNG